MIYNKEYTTKHFGKIIPTDLTIFWEHDEFFLPVCVKAQNDWLRHEKQEYHEEENQHKEYLDH